MRISVVSVLIAAASVARATVLLDQTPQQLMAQADLVVVGTITSQRVVQVNGQPMTESTVAVEETLKGKSAGPVVLSQLGGRMGRVVMDVPGDAQLHVGDRAVLLTYVHRDGRRYLVGMALGAWLLDKGTAHQAVDAPLMSSDGRLREAVPLHIPLTELKRRLQAAP